MEEWNGEPVSCAPDGTGAVLKSRELLEMKVLMRDAYDRGFKEGIQEGAQRDHLAVLVSDILESWLNSRATGIIESVVRGAIQTAIENYLEGRGFEFTLTALDN